MKITDTVKNRFTGKVMFGGLTLEVVLENHRKWVYAEDNGARAVLTDADLTRAVLTRAVLTDAVLTRAVLTDADLTDAVLTDAPFKIKDIHQKVYKAANKKDALRMDTWHTCDTTHCRAGWIVTLAGEAGKTLEFIMGTSAAANLIYIASDPQIGKMPNFYATNSEALEDMKLRAEKEASQ